MHTYLPRYAYIYSSLIFGENDTNIVNEIHAKAKHADIKDMIQPFIPAEMS